MKNKNTDREMYEREAREHEAGLEQALAKAYAELDTLETKLTNLRTAAERFIDSEIGFENMNAAIEASR